MVRAYVWNIGVAPPPHGVNCLGAACTDIMSCLGAACEGERQYMEIGSVMINYHNDRVDSKFVESN